MLTKKILIVDDNKELAQLFCEYFYIYKKKNDIDCEIAGVVFNGIEAVNFILTNDPDIVLLDIVMPMLDGFGVLEKLRSLHLEHQPKVVMLSGLSDNRSLMRTHDLKAVSFIEKPFEMEKVMSLLSHL